MRFNAVAVPIAYRIVVGLKLRGLVVKLSTRKEERETVSYIHFHQICFCQKQYTPMTGLSYTSTLSVKYNYIYKRL